MFNGVINNRLKFAIIWFPSFIILDYFDENSITSGLVITLFFLCFLFSHRLKLLGINIYFIYTYIFCNLIIIFLYLFIIDYENMEIISIVNSSTSLIKYLSIFTVLAILVFINLVSFVSMFISMKPKKSKLKGCAAELGRPFK
jgi:hypothetical protein